MVGMMGIVRRRIAGKSGRATKKPPEMYLTDQTFVVSSQERFGGTTKKQGS
jgi:hypothetical protein